MGNVRGIFVEMGVSKQDDRPEPNPVRGRGDARGGRWLLLRRLEAAVSFY
ncbi:MAG: hypothetical protein ACI82H_002061, partial [Alphaproteobacteria bacterium]